MNKNVDLNIGMSAVGKFESPMRKFNGLTSDSIKLVGQFGKSIRETSHQQKSISKLKVLREETKKLSAQQIEAKNRYEKLRQAVHAGGKPTKRLIQNYKAASNKLNRLTETQKQSRKEIARRLSALKREGIDTRNLTAEQERLGVAYAATTAKAKAYGIEQRRVHEANARVKRGVAEANARFDNASQRAANAALIGGAVSRGGRGLISAVRSPTQSAMGFEDAMTEVDKFVKGANIPELSKQIRELGGSSPIGSVGIASLVAAGGKINLNAKQSLEFAKISEKQSVAYGISVNEAANTITKIRTGMNLSMDEIRDLGNAINYLGDNSGSNAANINNIVSRIGAVGKASGLDNTEIAGLAAVIDSAAPNAEIASTSMKNILTALTGGEQLSNKQQDLFERLGFDSQDLAASMQENASKTIGDVLKAIAGENAEDRNGIISALFGRESQAAVSNMVGNIGEYTKVMNEAADSSKYADSTHREYARELDKSSVKLKISEQHWENVKIQLGSKLLPVLSSITNTLSPVISGISNFIEKHPALAKWSIIVAGGLGVAAVAIAPVVTGLYAMGVAAAWFAKQSAAATAAQAMGGMGGSGGKRGRGIGKGGLVGAGLGVLSIGSILLDDELSTQDKVKQTVSTGAGIAGAIAGAKGGAALGAFLGPVGAAIGGLIGGGVGFAAASWLGDEITGAANNEPNSKTIGRMANSSKGRIAEKTIADANTANAGVSHTQITDHSKHEINVHGVNNPEETAKIIMKKEAEIKRKHSRKHNRGRNLHDTNGALPA